MSLYIQVPIQQIADGLTAIGWSSAGGGGDATLSYASSAPLTPINGTLWWDTTNTLLKIYTGGVWTTVNVSAETIASISTSVSQAQSAATSASNSASQALDAKNAITGMQVATGAAGSSVTWNGTTLTVPQGIQGIKGDTGAGVPTGGTTGQILSKVDATNYNTTWIDAVGGGGFTYMEASNPLITTNGAIGDLWFNTTTMELFICRDATTNENEWEGDNGTNIAPIPQTLAYGVEWNQTTDTYTRTGLAVGTANSTSYAGSLQTGMRRCVLNANGTVNYYLHPTDSTKKADGSAAVIDGTAGNVMVEIPKFYYKYEYAAPVHKWSISPLQEAGYTIHPAFVRGGVEKDYRYYCAYEGYNSGGTLKSRSGVLPTASQKITTFRTQAQANGTGWSLIDWNLLYAVQMLFLTEYADFDTQAMIGNGNDTGSDYTITTGQSNSIGNASSPATNDDMWMSYRGIENWYSSMYKFIDGVNIQNRVYYVNNNPATYASDVFTGDYVAIGVTSASTNGYVSNVVASNRGFVAGATAGSSSTFIPDYFQQSAENNIMMFGGYSGYGLGCGGFCLCASYVYYNSSADSGSGVCF